MATCRQSAKSVLEQKIERAESQVASLKTLLARIHWDELTDREEELLYWDELTDREEELLWGI